MYKKKRVENTFFDQRFTMANKINNGMKKCPKSNDITATQSGDNVTVKCKCGHSNTTICKGIINEYDALADFIDSHP